MKHTPIVLVSLISLACSAPVLASEAMAKADGCLNCHAIDSKKVGPSFKDVAAKNGAEVVASLRVTLDNADFAPFLQRAADAKDGSSV